MRAGSIVSTLLLMAGTASANETIRCGSHIVTSAMAVDEILRKCGEPASRQSREEDVRAMNPNGVMVKVGTTVVEEWIYDRGSRAAPIRIRIADGKVRSIERIL